MSIAKLTLVNIIGDMSSLDNVILHCLDRGDFHPERAMNYAGGIRGFSPLVEENPYAELMNSLTDLGLQAGFPLQDRPRMRLDKSRAKFQKKYCEDFCRSFRRELTLLREQCNYLKSELEQDESALGHLTHINELDVDIDRLFSCTYLKVRVGRLPVDSFRKLPLYEDKMFLFVPFDTNKNYCWGIIFAPAAYISEVDDLFSSLYFERERVPDFIHGKPEQAFAKLSSELSTNKAKYADSKERMKELIESRKKAFYVIYDQVRFLSDSYEMRTYVAAMRRNFLDLFHITGFIAKEDGEEFAAQLREFKGVTVELLPAGADKRIKEPTMLKNGWFAKPFEMFVEMYGLPSYNDIDPTPFVAFTYCLLFGIMFGDLGQGLLLVLAGALFWRWKHMNIGRVINRVGISSSIFGTLYGSVFGFEHLLDPFYQGVFGLPGKPIEVMAPETTNVVLLGAVALGVGLILISMMLNIVGAFRRHDLERALFSANGVAGVVFYGAVLVGAVLMFLKGINLFNPVFVILLLLLPLCAILMKEPLGKLIGGASPKEAKPEGGMGAYVMEGVFELIEVVLSFFSNTMSFLRVGGFVLSHAGMMAVVFTLTEMMSAGAGPAVIIFGNLFVIVLEGLIVGIQVLRLEFYEMFSRYYDGDGKPFIPIGITNLK